MNKKSMAYTLCSLAIATSLSCDHESVTESKSKYVPIEDIIVSVGLPLSQEINRPYFEMNVERAVEQMKAAGGISPQYLKVNIYDTMRRNISDSDYCTHDCNNCSGISSRRDGTAQWIANIYVLPKERDGSCYVYGEMDKQNWSNGLGWELAALYNPSNGGDNSACECASMLTPTALKIQRDVYNTSWDGPDIIFEEPQ